jgi:predicted ATPase
VSELIELSTHHNFSQWLALGAVLRGWARSASGDTAEGHLVEHGMGDWRATGSMLGVPFHLALRAEVLYLQDRTTEALEAIRETQELIERSGERWWCAELYRLRAVFLASVGAEEKRIEASFCEAVRIAKEQKSVSLEKRAKEPTQNIAGKKRARQEDMDSDRRFDDVEGKSQNQIC